MHDLAGLRIPAPPAPDSYQALRDVRFTGETLRPSVCLVTGELIGPFKNGGIGTATTGLAELLAGEGLRVTVLYTGAVWTPELNLGPWRKHYAARGIELTAISFDEMRSIGGPLRECGLGAPWLVYRWLRGRRFDVIHFNDCLGDGSLALAAKRAGLAFADTLLVVALHGPSRWVFELNHILPSDRFAAAADYAERLSVASADVLLSPSRYLLDWARARGFELPEQTFVQQYAVPGVDGAGARRGRAPIPQEIVFFGRLEERKGLRTFCSAVNLLRDEIARRGITVTFLGKPARCAGVKSLDYIARRAAGWPFPVRTLTDLGQPEALGYLRDGRKLAVMPSPLDNSPCTVYEALGSGIPFLAARTGGIPELVADADHDRVLFDDSTEALRAALHDAIARGGWIATAAVAQRDTRDAWRAMHAHWRRFMRRKERPDRPGGRVAAIVDHPSGADLDRTLRSLRACPHVHRVLILNRGGDLLAEDNFDLMTTDVEAVEHELASIAEDRVLLIHSGVRLVASAFEGMLGAIERPGINGLVPAGHIADGVRSRSIPPLGGSTIFSLFEGATFTGALFVRRSVLVRATAGRTLASDSPFLGLADFIVTRIDRILPYPEPVVERSPGSGFEANSSWPTRVAAYGEASADDRYYMLAAAYGASTHRRVPSLNRLAMAAVDRGFGVLVRAGARLWRRLR